MDLRTGFLMRYLLTLFFLIAVLSFDADAGIFILGSFLSFTSCSSSSSSSLSRDIGTVKWKVASGTSDGVISDVVVVQSGGDRVVEIAEEEGLSGLAEFQSGGVGVGVETAVHAGVFSVRHDVLRGGRVGVEHHAVLAGDGGE